MDNNFDQILMLGTIPFVAALIGYATNFLAVKMIFRPRRALRVMGLELWGLIPKRQPELASSIAEAVERDLISHQDIQSAMDQAGFEAVIESMIARELERFAIQAKARNPLLKMVLRPELLLKIHADFLAHLRPRVPALMDELWDKLAQKLDVKQIVSQKIAAFDLQKLESMIYDISSKELKRIELLGGVIGFVIGLAQVALLWLQS